jgi:hypothetical protein
MTQQNLKLQWDSKKTKDLSEFNENHVQAQMRKKIHIKMPDNQLICISMQSSHKI